MKSISRYVYYKLCTEIRVDAVYIIFYYIFIHTYYGLTILSRTHLVLPYVPIHVCLQSAR